MARFLILALLTLIGTGCTHAMLKTERKDGGRISFSGPPDKSMKQAKDLMSKKCPNGYEEVEKGSESSGMRVGGGLGGGSIDVPSQYIDFKCLDQSAKSDSSEAKKTTIKK
jgi:hypothetical protein